MKDRPTPAPRYSRPAIIHGETLPSRSFANGVLAPNNAAERRANSMPVRAGLAKATVTHLVGSLTVAGSDVSETLCPWLRPNIQSYRSGSRNNVRTVALINP